VREAFAALAAPLEGSTRPVLRGADGWLFFGPELRHLGAGVFWGERAAAVSRARRVEWADPLAAILDFRRQLDEAGVELLFVPVPAKATIYPEHLPRPIPATTDRVDAADATFYEVLRRQGVEVLDLAPAFRRARQSQERPLFCKQDTHWSGAGIEEAARRISERVRSRPWLEGVAKQRLETRPHDVEITGDLWKMLGDPQLPKERVRIREVGRREGSVFEPVSPWRESPVLLLGDSHTLVFHGGGDMHARGAGLPDHLARELGFPVDLVGVRGSGATPSRINLLRRGDGLAGKKLVVWCLSVREFTEALQGWRPLPVRAGG
jgi:alginate O-acetyltransferase complex protein AlgJ